MTQAFAQQLQEYRCLILEDDLPTSETLVQAVATTGGEALVSGTVAEGRMMLDKNSFDVFVLDHLLPDGTGAAFYSELRARGITAPCIMLTGVPQISLAVELTRNGLFDYLTKPFDLHRFLDCLRRAVVHATATRGTLEEFGLVDASPAMKTVRQLVIQASANPNTTILLTGETGVGKDLIARLIHQLTFEGQAPQPPFVSLNCSNLPAEMFEAELFGAQKGAYTGAHQNRAGVVEAAMGGSLFLDEIGEVPLLLQSKLLQLVETQEYRTLGNNVTKRFEGRILAATNRPLEIEVQKGRFRADLWYRLDVFNIHIPPLRERQEDLKPLAEILLDSLCQKYQWPKPLLKPADLAALQNYSFPGNVRELRNVLERSLLQTPRQSKWLEIDLRRLPQTPDPIPEETTPAATPPPMRSLSRIEEQEYQLIRKTLLEEQGFVRRAAKKLNMSHQALLRRLTKWPELRGQ